MGIFNTKWPFYFSGTVLAFIILTCLYVLNDTVGMGDSMKAINEFCSDAVHDGTIKKIYTDHSVIFVLSMMLGAFTASLFSSNFRLQISPDCGGSFTSRQFKGVVGGFIGGFITMLGVQLSGESIFGHLAGAIQLSGTSWLFLAAMLFSGTMLALLFERRGIAQDGGDK